MVWGAKGSGRVSRAGDRNKNVLSLRQINRGRGPDAGAAELRSGDTGAAYLDLRRVEIMFERVDGGSELCRYQQRDYDDLRQQPSI